MAPTVGSPVMSRIGQVIAGSCSRQGETHLEMLENIWIELDLGISPGTKFSFIPVGIVLPSCDQALFR